jgi:hypothetical protein
MSPDSWWLLLRLVFASEDEGNTIFRNVDAVIYWIILCHIQMMPHNLLL